MENSNGKFFNHISSVALLLEKANQEQEIYLEIANKLKELYPEIFVVISLISPQKYVYKINVIKGLERFRKKIDSLLGTDVLSMEFPLEDLSESDLRLNRNNKLMAVRGGLYTLARKRIPRSVSMAIERLIGVEKVYSLGMAVDEFNLGNITIFLPKNFQFSQSDILFIETLSVIGSIALQKIRALGQLTKDAEKVQQILQTAPAGIGVVVDRVLREVNERVCEITGYTKEELINKSAMMLYPTEEEYARVGEEKYKMLRETGTGQVDTIWKSKNGNLRNILLRSSAINPTNFSEGVIFTALDVTEKKTMEKELQESEERYRSLVENSPVAIMIHRQGVIEFLNQTGLRLIEAETPDQPIGMNALELVHPDDRQSAMERITRMYQTGKPAPVAEERFMSLKGNVVNLQVAANIIQYRGGPASLVFGLDISDLKKAEDEIIRFSKELEEINKSKDKFFSIIAHDLKGPFNSILGFADILNTEYDDFSDEERKHFIRNIVSSAQNTFRLLENLLEWSRAQTNRMEFKPEPLELSAVINETILLVRGQAEAKDIHLFSAVEFNTRVFADENMVKTILRNLFSNAIKFSRRRGNVRVMEKRCKHSVTNKEMIEVIMKDDGVGMSKEILSQLFRIDQMVRTPGTDNEKGTGLGLLLCQELVLRNGGEIWATSEPGNGTTIHFTLQRD